MGVKRRGHRLGGIIVVLFSTFLIAGVVAWAPPASAQVITVDTTDDQVNADAFCSLREAIISANENSATSACAQGSATETDHIILDVGTYELTIGGTNENNAATGDLDITEPVNISGPGASVATVDANGIDRVFDALANARLSYFTVKGGSLSASAGDEGGGGIRYYFRLTLSDMVVKRNAMIGGTGSDYGGGVGTAFVAGSELTLLRTTIKQNQAFVGGGLGTGNSVRVRSSLIWQNSASGGAGIYSNGVMRLDNVTVSHNAATNAVGGIQIASGSVSMRNVTVASNEAGSSGFAANIGTGGTTEAKNTIVAKPVVGRNCDAHLTSNGHNLEDADSCGFTRPSDIQNRPSRLKAVRNNGGRTLTRAIKPSSAAKDAGGNCLASDQRGVPRPGSACDIGAYELARCAGVLVNRVGTRFSDTVRGTSGADGVLGLGGGDDLAGFGGRDGMCGGTGTDFLRGGADNDTLRGEGGADTLRGGPGNDDCIGGPGTDSAGGCESREGI